MTERLYGDQNFRFDETSEGALFILVGGNDSDPVSGSNPFSVIDFVHYKTHEGRYFSGGHYSASVANGASIDLLIQTSSAQTFHSKISASCGGDSTFQIYENATFSNAGSSVSMANHNRSSAKVFSGTVTHTPTITGTGTQLNGTVFIAGGSGPHSSGGENGFQSEFILAVSKVYLVRATNISGSANPMSVIIEGYNPSL